MSQLLGAGDPHSMATWAERYLEWLRSRNYSERTAINRESYARASSSGGAKRGRCRCPQEVTKPILERYQRHLFHLRRTDGKPLTASGAERATWPLHELLQVAHTAERAALQPRLGARDAEGRDRLAAARSDGG